MSSGSYIFSFLDDGSSSGTNGGGGGSNIGAAAAAAAAAAARVRLWVAPAVYPSAAGPRYAPGGVPHAFLFKWSPNHHSRRHHRRLRCRRCQRLTVSVSVCRLGTTTSSESPFAIGDGVRAVQACKK